MSTTLLYANRINQVAEVWCIHVASLTNKSNIYLITIAIKSNNNIASMKNRIKHNLCAERYADKAYRFCSDGIVYDFCSIIAGLALILLSLLHTSFSQ